MNRLTAVAALSALIAIGCSSENVTVASSPEATEAPTQSTAPETTAAAAPAPDLSASDLLSDAIESTVSRAVRGQLRVEGDMVDAGNGAMSVDFQTDAQGDIEAMLSSGDEQSGPPLTVRIVDGQTYAGFPGVMAAQMFPDFGGETAWFTVSGQNAEGFAIACASPLAQLGVQPGGCDPAADLRRLADAAEEATFAGDEEVGGVPARRLRFMVSPASLPSAGAASDGFGDDPAAALGGNIAIDVWIDADMLLRRLVVDLSSIFGGFAEAFGGEDASTEIPTWQSVVEYYEFDESISIEAPSPESLLGDYAQVQGFVG